MKKELLSVAILGYTGAVGREVLKSLVDNSKVKQLKLLGRRELDVKSSCEILSHIVNINDTNTYNGILDDTDSAICTLGVGEPTKISKEEFIKIDKDAVIIFAKACKNAGIRHFQLLGSVSSSANSKSFYLRTKGELVEELISLKFERLSVYQPSMILTPKNRYGFSQALTLKIWPVLSHLLIGKLSKFKGVKIEILGKSIANNLFTNGSGTDVFHLDDFKKLTDIE